MKAAASTFTSGSVISLTGSNPMVILRTITNYYFIYMHSTSIFFFVKGFDTNEIIKTTEKLHFCLSGRTFG